jgi:hypothetical protein
LRGGESISGKSGKEVFKISACSIRKSKSICILAKNYPVEYETFVNKQFHNAGRGVPPLPNA